MDISEYLAFIPLLLYGIGLADLLSQWKRLFQPSEWYLPYSLLTVIFTESAIYNIFIYHNLIGQFTELSYITYLSFLAPPFLFLLTVSVFTPEEDSNTETYIRENLSLISLLTALFLASHFLHEYKESEWSTWGRFLYISVCLFIALTRKIWPIYVLVVLWAMSFAYRGISLASF